MELAPGEMLESAHKVSCGLAVVTTTGVAYSHKYTMANIKAK